MAILCECDICHKKFVTTPARASKVKRCSWKCEVKARTQTGVKARGFCNINNRKNWCPLPKNQITFYCLNCGKSFLEWKSNKRKYCSKQCYYTHTNKSILSIKQCVNCGKEIKSRRKFCSRKCFVTYKSKESISGLIESLRNSEQYLHWRNRVYRRDKWRCVECGKHCKEDIQAHHLIPFSKLILGNIQGVFSADRFITCLLSTDLWSINFGVTLCKSCHAKKHRVKEFKNHYQTTNEMISGVV